MGGSSPWSGLDPPIGEWRRCSADGDIGGQAQPGRTPGDECALTNQVGHLLLFLVGFVTTGVVEEIPAESSGIHLPFGGASRQVTALDGGAAAVGGEDGTGQVAGFVRGEEGNDLGDLVDLGAPSQQ
jgi:hypothetical protein